MVASSVAATSPDLDRAMDRHAQGDEAAFRELHDGLAPRLQRFLQRLCGSAALAADLTQEAFLRMHRARASFGDGAAVVPWALAIARNAYIDHARRRATRILERAAGPEEDPDAPSNQVPSMTGHGEQHALAREAADVVGATLAAMPLAHREAFLLLRYEGLSVAEAAETLGTTENAVKMRAFRAYEALRAALQHRDGGR